jgi:hypothetical protein
LAAGAVQDTTADESFGAADTPVEAAGAGCGVTDTGGLDAGPAPIELLATTVTVYAVPLVSPLIVHVVVAVVHDAPPGEALAV